MVYWRDVKGGYTNEAYPEFQSFAINGPLIRFNIHDNTIKNTMDGISIEGQHGHKNQKQFLISNPR